MRLPFVKMMGAGNDFIVLERHRVSGLGDDACARLATGLCRRRFSVGADGILVLEPLGKDRVRMVYYNSDGSRAAMCGNGARCAARYARWKDWTGPRLILEADDGPHAVTLDGRRVRLGMKAPAVRDDALETVVGEGVLRGAWLDTGVPHVVLWVEDVSGVDVDAWGRAVRLDPRFGSEGTNVNFAQSLGGSAVKVRTYERGVEGETLACGTGVVAAAVAAFLQKGARPPVEVQAIGGTLSVGFESNQHGIDRVTLEGDAEISFEGIVDLSECGGAPDG